MAEYRPLPGDRIEDSRGILRYAFDAGSGPHDPTEELTERRRRMWDFGETRGMFAEAGAEGDGDGTGAGADPELLACYTHIEFTARLRGEWLPLAGVTGVASPPEHRRKGLVREMMRAALREYRDRGWPLSALRPFDEGFYARLGWATGCRYETATVDPAALSRVGAPVPGEFRRIHPGDYERLVPVYEEWLAGRDLATRRSADWWRDRVFQDWSSELYCYAVERDGEVRGYLLYSVDDGGETTLSVDEMAYRDGEAYLELLRFCYHHEAQVDAVELVGPDATRVLEVVEDRGAVETGVRPGQMVRVVDVPAALEALPYPGVDRAAVTVAVADDHAPWNEATWRIRVVDGAATVTETDAAPDAELDVGTLSGLLVGHRSVERARAAGDLVLGDPGAADTLAALFPEGDPYLPESF